MKQITLTSTCLSIFLFFVGCSDQVDTLNLKDSGEVSVVIVDSNGSPVPDGIVDLRSESGDFRYERIKTDKNGSVNFGAFNSGNYFLNIEVTNAGNFYSIIKIIQVVSGVNKTYEIDLSEYISSLTVHLNNYQGEPVDGTGYSLKITPINYNGEEDLSTSLDFDHSSITFEPVPTGAYYVEILNKEKKPITSKFSSYVEQYEPSEFTISVHELEFRIRAKNTYSITSVKNLYNSTTLEHPYQTFALGPDNNFTLALNDESEYGGSYYFYNDRMDLNWNSSSFWIVYQTNITEKGFNLTCYDYYLGQEVLITFE